MAKENITTGLNITREEMIQLLNEDLAGEYQAIIAYTCLLYTSEDVPIFRCGKERVVNWILVGIL